MQAFRNAALGLAALAAAMVAAESAQTKPIVTEKTKYYSIWGKTGQALLVEMNRRGPRHGFLRKAIAQTQYTTTPRGQIVHGDGTCRVSGGGVDIEITYVYPKPSNRLPPDLARRWRLFQADNVRHERAHGRVARQMAVELDRKIRGFSMKDGSTCRRTLGRLQRELQAIHERYEKMQNDFDRREHREGGEVEKSVRILVGN